MVNVHTPVLVEEICLWLKPTPGGIYVDCTVGAGGTSLNILKKAGKNAFILANGTSCRHQISDFSERKPKHIAELLFNLFERIN